MKRIDKITKRWIKNASDEAAVANGCLFDEAAGQFVVNWMKQYLRLYEGEFAGMPFECRGWQYDVTMRMFGWVKPSERYGRNIRRFRQAAIWIPKKNGKSPTLAAWGLYLLIADGEQGQKVFFGAKDGTQAREIAGKHAIEMLMSSDELMRECEINKVEMRITHNPSRSMLKPISSGDSKSQKTKEGINGCILIDETHVVDRSFMNRVSRAGISRSEPLQIEVSTAGSDPEGYGRDRYEYGKSVADGLLVDESLLHVAYECEATVDDAAIMKDPAKYGKQANPMWGITIDPQELIDDCKRSSRSRNEFADFKMYRLNIWQASASPWLVAGDWEQCKQDYTEHDLIGQPCFGAFDLAKTTDTSAFVLNFPQEDGSYKQLAWNWLPEFTAENLRDKVPYHLWEENGWVTFSEDKTTDYNLIRKFIIDLIGRHNVQAIVHDGWYAEQLVQRMTNEDGLPIGLFESFTQSMKLYGPPTAAYERAVIDHKMNHNGNPLFTWQVMNATVKQNSDDKRPIKQKHADYKTIDGAICAVMALAKAMSGPAGLYRYYETNEVEMA